MKPIEIACRATNADGINCGAQAGEKCRWPHPWAELMGFHAERIEDAAQLGGEGAPAKPAQFTAAVEKSGKV